MRDLAGKVAVVTGGASGIGLGIAQALAGAGMRLVIADIEREAGQRAAAELRSRGAEVLLVTTDVSNAASVEVLARRTFDELGGAHVVCNNAGVIAESAIAAGSDDDWRWMMSVNLEGVRNGIKAFVPRMRLQGQGGHVVNTASLSGLLPAAYLGSYTATKFAVVGLSESLRLELEPDGIGVSTLLPPAVNTRLATAGRNRPERFGGAYEDEGSLGSQLVAGIDPGRVGEAVLEGVRDDARFIFPDGAFIDVLRAQFQSFLDAMEKAPALLKQD